MANRTYGQFCGLARALELVGERWALLIIRDLTVGPRRFTDLRLGLPGIPTNILTDRLKELEQSAVVRRRVLPRPATAVVYELTEYGHDLEDVIARLGRWGARSLGQPRPGEIVTTDSLVVALRSIFQPGAAGGQQVTFDLRLGDIVLHARVDRGTLRVEGGPAEHADLVIQTVPTFKDLLTGDLTPADAIASGTVHLTGDPRLLDRFVELFHIPPPPAALMPS